MSRIVSRAESFEKVFEAFNVVNFNAFDFNTIKQSLIDYIKIYFPEDFNDYIESSEFIAVLELFAYIGELTAYRLDLNAHENFITTAQRKESVLRLAKFISYKASRNVPLRGLVKMTSIQTTEDVFDSAGRNLANTKIVWNDPGNQDWKEQFLLVMGRVLKQEFGSVTPDERVQIDDVLFELYTLNNTPLANNNINVFKYGASNSGQSLPMELVPVDLSSVTGLREKRPEVALPFTLLYATDGLGDASDTTGFLLYTKQGTLNRAVTNFDGVTPNQIFEIEVNNINDTDLWINNIDPNTQKVIETDPNKDTLPKALISDARFGEWLEVDIANAQNIIFNTNINRRKYEIETKNADQVRIIFGDGEFAEIPNGTFEIWYRVSQNLDVILPKSGVVNQGTSFTYVDTLNSTQTLSFTFSLVSSLLNNSISEDIEHIRRVAPSVYYTQDRMVNARDYNVFMLQDPSILKLKALNRTFAGDSKYIAWHDPREFYENVKLFGDDMALYFQDEAPATGSITIVNQPLTANQLILDVLEPFLSSTDFFLVLGPLLEANGLDPASLRRLFNNDTLELACTGFIPTGETDAMAAALNPVTFPLVVDLYYSVPSASGPPGYDEWTVGPHCLDPNSVHMFRITALFSGSSLRGWDVRHRTRRLIAHSEVTKFWNTNTVTKIINYDTETTSLDNIVVLKANPNSDRNALLAANITFNVLGQELVEQNLPNAGLPDIHRLSLIQQDTNDDRVPDNLDMPEIFDFTLQSSQTNICPDPNFLFTPIPSRGIHQVLLSGVVSEFDSTGLSDNIVGVSPCNPGAFVVSGDRTARYTTGNIINVVESTGNDGTYTLLANSTFNIGTNTTTIPVTTNVPFATVDGRLAQVFETNITINIGAPPPYTGAVASVLIDGNDANNYVNLVAELNAKIGLAFPIIPNCVTFPVPSVRSAVASFSPTAITISSNFDGGDSTIFINEGTPVPIADADERLFTNLQHFSSFAIPMNGSDAANYILSLPFDVHYISGEEANDLEVWVSDDATPVFPADFVQLSFGSDWLVPTAEDLNFLAPPCFVIPPTCLGMYPAPIISASAANAEANSVVKRRIKFATFPATGFSDAIVGVVPDVVFPFTGSFDVATDKTSVYTTGLVFTVSGSTGNDGTYTVSAPGSTFGLVTTIPVDEAVPSAVADGSITPQFSPCAPHFVYIKSKDYVYLTRETSQDPFAPVSLPSDSIRTLWAIEDHVNLPRDSWRFNRYPGRAGLNFAWFHRSPRFHLVDPSAQNIIDIYIITKGYNTSVRRFLDNKIDVEPATPTPLDLRLSYEQFIDNKMISDTIIFHPGKLKVIFGSKAPLELQASFKVIRPTATFLSNNEVKVRIVEIIKSFFDINLWEFGETFYFSELAAAVHQDLGTEIDSIVLVPLFAQTQFGDLFQIPAREDEIFIPDIDVDDIEIVASYTPEVLRQLE